MVRLQDGSKVLDRGLQSRFPFDRRLPIQQRSGFGNVRSAELGIILRQGLLFDPTGAAREFDDPKCSTVCQAIGT